MSELQMERVTVAGQKDPKVRVLSVPSVEQTGANLKFIAHWKHEEIEFVHVYVELITVSETIGDMDEVDGNMFMQQLASRAYNTVEWVELTFEDGTTRTLPAIVCQDASSPAPDSIDFMIKLIRDKDVHGWEVFEDGTIKHHHTGRTYSVTYVNAFTGALHKALGELQVRCQLSDNVIHFAMLNALPFFKEMYLADMTKVAEKERWGGWHRGVKMSKRAYEMAVDLCPLPEPEAKTKA